MKAESIPQKIRRLAVVYFVALTLIALTLLGSWFLMHYAIQQNRGVGWTPFSNQQERKISSGMRE